MLASFLTKVLISLFSSSILFDDGNVVAARRHNIYEGQERNKLESVRTLESKAGKKKTPKTKDSKRTKNQQLSELECFAALQASGFDLFAYEKYDDFFADDSVMTLAQAGQYIGADAIKEYVAYMTPESPYFSSSAITGADFSFRAYDKKNGICSFRHVMTVDYGNNPEVTCSSTEYTLSVMIRIEFNPRRGVVEIINVYYDDAYFDFHFATFASSDCTRQFVCDALSSDSCSNPVENCVEKLASLPVAEWGYIDGNSQGCRFLHAVLAQFDNNHCDHIAFEPTLDRDGKIKCQESLWIMPGDLFEESDFDAFRTFQERAGIPPGVGYVLKQ